jgi:septal ring factor EnvC (AmiA/AmiB activator)
MSTPTFTREDLEVLAGGQTLAGGRIADVCDLARYALALVRNINEWMIYKQRRIDDLEAELAAEQGETEEVDRQWKKAIEQYTALEAERDDLKEAVAQEKYFHDEDIERFEAERDALKAKLEQQQNWETIAELQAADVERLEAERDALKAENEKLRNARVTKADLDRLEAIVSKFGEKDGGK